MITIEFVFQVGDRVTTPFGDLGIIVMLGYNESGNRYYVKTAIQDSWFKEYELTHV